MSFGIFKIFQIFGIVSTWATQALADGKVTLAEAVDLVTQLCAILGVTPELEIPGSEPTGEEVISKASTITPDTSKETDPTSGDRAPPETTSLEFSDQAEEGQLHTAKEVTEL